MSRRLPSGPFCDRSAVIVARRTYDLPLGSTGSQSDLTPWFRSGTRETLLVLPSDAKGIVMRPDSLRIHTAAPPPARHRCSAPARVWRKTSPQAPAIMAGVVESRSRCRTPRARNAGCRSDVLEDRYRSVARRCRTRGDGPGTDSDAGTVMAQAAGPRTRRAPGNGIGPPR